MTLSKELLSEVVGFTCEVSEYQRGHTHEVEVYVEDEIKYFYINIYELAHKCKEWAIKDGKYVLHSATAWNYSAVCIVNLGTEAQKRFYADTEPEAIFKACQWILEQKAKA